MNSQDRIEAASLVLGRSFQNSPRNVDRRVPNGNRTTPPLSLSIGGEVFAMDRDSHLITLAPNSSDKNRSVIIPNLLTYPGPVVVIDPTGEKYAVTARARREMETLRFAP